MPFRAAFSTRPARLALRLGGAMNGATGGTKLFEAKKATHEGFMSQKYYFCLARVSCDDFGATNLLGGTGHSKWNSTVPGCTSSFEEGALAQQHVSCIVCLSIDYLDSWRHAESAEEQHVRIQSIVKGCGSPAGTNALIKRASGPCVRIVTSAISALEVTKAVFLSLCRCRDSPAASVKVRSQSPSNVSFPTSASFPSACTVDPQTAPARGQSQVTHRLTKQHQHWQRTHDMKYSVSCLTDGCSM